MADTVIINLSRWYLVVGNFQISKDQDTMVQNIQFMEFASVTPDLALRKKGKTNYFFCFIDRSAVRHDFLLYLVHVYCGVLR